MNIVLFVYENVSVTFHVMCTQIFSTIDLKGDTGHKESNIIVNVRKVGKYIVLLIY
jgi:hypothetical protein